MKKLILLSSLLAAPLAIAVDTAYSPPIGGMTVSVPASSTRAISLPLLPSAVGSGSVIGKIDVVGSNFIDVTSANWTPGSFSNVAFPYILRIKSGNAAGRVIPVSTTTANTATRVNLTTDGFNLDTVESPSSGDSYELILADTLSSFFGSTTLQGGADYLSADNVLIWGNTAWVCYYYNTTRSRWERSTDTGASATRDNTLLRQDRGFMIVRRAATALTIYVTGRVPEVAPEHLHLRPGSTFFSNGLPATVTLGALALHNSAGWQGVAGASSALTSADLIQIWGNTSWVYYYYDTGRGSWQRSTDTEVSASRNTVAISPGQPVMIRRLTTAAAPADNFITMPLPYTVSF